MSLSISALRYMAIIAFFTRPASWLNTIPARAASDRPAGVGPSDKVVLPGRSRQISTILAARSGMAGRTHRPLLLPDFRSRVCGWLKNPAGVLVAADGDVLVAESDLAKANPPRRPSVSHVVARCHTTKALRSFAICFSGSESCFRHDAHRQPALRRQQRCDSGVRLPEGSNKNQAPARKIAYDAHRGHYTRNLLANVDGSRSCRVGSFIQWKRNGMPTMNRSAPAILR